MEEVKSEIEGELVKVDTAPQERSTLALPFKKRRYVEPLAYDNSGTNISTVKETQVVKYSDATQKKHNPKDMSSDKSADKKKRQDKKKKQKKQKRPEASLPQPTNEASSSQIMHAPCQDEACAGTSGTRFLSPTKQEPEIYKLTKKFNELEFSKILQGTEFTKEQSKILQQSLMQVSRKMPFITANSDRFIKTHNCRRCDFSISHQCMSLDFIRSDPLGIERLCQASMVPRQIVICKCGFACCHIHLNRTRNSVQDLRPKLAPYLIEYKRHVDVSCRKCYINIVMSNRRTKVCCDLNTWGSIDDHKRQRFYDTVQSRLQYEATELSLDQFSSCSKKCCLIFHRCSRKAEVPSAGPT